MKKQLCLILSAVLFACGCAGAETEAGPESSADVKPAETAASIASNEPDYTTGKPWMVIDIAGNVTEDTPVNVKDDFALYANKDKILAIPFREGDAAAGPLVDALNQREEDLKNLFAGEAPEDPDAKTAFDFYELLCDWDSRNALGIAPLREMTAQVEAISSLEELTAYFMNTPEYSRLAELWRTMLKPDPDDADHNVIAINSGHFTYAEPEEYTTPSEDSEMKKEALADYAAKMCVKLGYDEAEGRKKAENCLKIEGLLAQGMPNTLEIKTTDYIAKSNNIWTREELKEAEGPVPILETLEGIDGFPKQEKFRISQPESILRLAELYTEENLPLLKDYLIVHGFQLNGSLLDWDTYVLDSDYSNQCAGRGDLDAADMESFRDEAHTTVLGFLPFPMAKLYVEKYMTPEIKERVSKLTEEIIREYYGIINEADFLSDKSREGAIAKLDKMKRKIAYPDDWSDYSCEDLHFRLLSEGGSYWEAVRELRKYENRKTAEKLTKPINKDLWDSNPMIVNCEYDPAVNGINVYAGYIKGMYRPDMSDEELYAEIGVSIGHEISHAFDDRGSQFDADGNLADWWDPEDFRVFTEKNAKLAAYYDGMQPWDGEHYHSEIMTGEALADMTGMKVILRLAAKNPDFDYDKFFKSYAGLWLTKESVEITKARLMDEHPLRCLRINCTLQQYDEFLNFYDIKEGDGMYLAPEDRVAIW